MRKLLFLFFPLFPILFSPPAVAQTQGVLGRRFFSNWSVGIGGGPNIFFGDLKVNKFWPASENMNEWRYAGTFNLTRQLSHVFALRGQVLYGEISGTKRQYKSGGSCNQYFEGNILEYNLNTTINFSNLFFRYKSQRKFFIYGTLGVGFSNWITKKKDLLTNKQIGGSGSEGNWTTEVVIPAGLGAYVNIGDKVNLGIEWTVRGVNSDKLDATEGGFKYDMYSLLALTLTYNFNKPNLGNLSAANVGRTSGPIPSQFQPPAPKPIQKPENGPTPRLHFPQRDSVTAKEVPLPPPDSSDFPEATVDSAWMDGPVQPGISYRVQIFAFRSNTFSATDIRKKFKLKQTVYKEFSEGWYRYTLGSFKSLKAAQSLQRQVKSQKGIHDAFVARYKDGKRIPTRP
ncbi:MAG: SPOR domain-containing protein [Bacteroidales bacterium]|nr:SPOR domain-containing protein [Bacteroidales bacterium]